MILSYTSDNLKTDSVGKSGQEKEREGERGTGWENGREGDTEEKKRQMRFKRNGNTGG